MLFVFSCAPASVHPRELAPRQLLVVWGSVPLHVPRQPAGPRLPLLLPAGLLGLPALRLRLHVSAGESSDGSASSEKEPTVCVSLLPVFGCRT